MKRSWVLAAALAVAAVSPAAAQEGYQPSPENLKARQWFQEARFGLFILEGARAGGGKGQSIVPEGWLGQATSERVGIGQPGRGYGYQWWTYDDGSFAARGIFGQGIFIDPKRKLVIASNADWGGGAFGDVETFGAVAAVAGRFVA